MEEANIVLPEEMSIRTAHASRDLLAPRFAAPAGEIVLDGAAVARIDAAGLQILLACDKAARAAGARVTIAPCSAALAATLALAGVARRFGLPAEGEA